MKSVRILLAVLLLLLRLPVLHAQEASGWLHPELSASTYLTGAYDPGADEGRFSVLSALSATLGRLPLIFA